MIYGNPKPRIDGVSFEPNGKASLSISLPWQPSRTGQSVAELLNEIPAGPTVSGYGIISRGTRRDNGVLRSLWEYEGTGSVDADTPVIAVCSFQPAWAERSLLLHPDWEKLAKKYGGYVDQGTGRIIWPPKYAQTDNTGYVPQYNASYKANPMYGRQTYEDLVGGFWIVRYVTNSRKEAETRIGDIFRASELPGDAPDFPNRNYLKTCPKFDKIGTGWAVEDTYKLSDVGGWNAEIYKNWSEA